RHEGRGGGDEGGEGGGEGGGDEHLVGAPGMAPGDVAGESVLAVARREPAAQVELDVFGDLGLELSASAGEEEHHYRQQNEPHQRFRRLIVFCSVSLSGLDLSDSCQIRFASSRWPITQRTSPR